MNPSSLQVTALSKLPKPVAQMLSYISEDLSSSDTVPLMELLVITMSDSITENRTLDGDGVSSTCWSWWRKRGDFV